MDEAERGLHDLLVERLLADESVGDEVTGLVLAAWTGEDDLTEALAGRPTPAADPHTPAPRSDRPDAYLAAVHVTGFRGVGPDAMLPLRPGPGLTLVTGRNGSGKSSFAEAAELALTGDSARWSGRTGVWREGWRNLHATDPPSVAVDMVTAGAPGTTRIARRWAAEDDLDGGRWTIQEPGAKRVEFDGAGWAEDMTTYRPFLSYGELGALIDGSPSKLHDALFRLLGLGPLSLAQDRLKTARKPLDDAVKRVNADRRALRADLEHIEDERAARAEALLRKTAPDLEQVAELAGGSDEDTTVGDALRALLRLTLPTADRVREVTARLRHAQEAHAAIATADARTADETARLLRAALEHHAGHGDEPCPVCGSGSLDAGWRARADERAAELEATAAALRRATAELSAAVGELRGLTTTPLPRTPTVATVDTDALTAAWAAWTGAGEDPDAVDAAHGPAQAALDNARKAAEAELAHRDDVWAPLARRLATWHDDALAARRNQPALARLTAADTWLVATAGALRDQRLAPFAEASQRVWRTLRQQSNVDLGPVRLDGKGNRRRVALDVSVDDVDGGSALAVMSQGELHALGLSLFLPRATVEESPFRFVMIDDPVQAMDPAKVDGLATLLSEVARERQVVVFSHDDRLADSVRRLQVPATIYEVQRRERSAVQVHRSGDPVARYLSDARALALADDMPPDVRSELVATCCRSAIEAACHEKVRRVRLTRGDAHADVERLLAGTHTTHKLATLAVFDDPDRGSDLLGRITSARGRDATSAFQDCKKGAHTGLRGDLRRFLSEVEKVARWLRD